MNISRTSRLMAAAITLAAVAATSEAEVTLSSGEGHVRNNSGIALYNFGSTVYENYDGETMDAGVDWSSTVGFARDGGPDFNATVSSHGAWAYSPSNTGLGGPISSVALSGLATLDVTTNTQNTEEFINAGIGHSLYVNFAAETQWNFSGVFDVMSTSTGAGEHLYGWNIQVLELDGPFPFPWLVESYEHLESSGNSAFQEDVSEGGTLGAGRYIFILNAFVGVEYIEQEGQFGSTTQSLQLTNGLIEFNEIPAPGTSLAIALGLGYSRRRRRGSCRVSQHIA